MLPDCCIPVRIFRSGCWREFGDYFHWAGCSTCLGKTQTHSVRRRWCMCCSKDFFSCHFFFFGKRWPQAASICCVMTDSGNPCKKLEHNVTMRDQSRARVGRLNSFDSSHAQMHSKNSPVSCIYFNDAWISIFLALSSAAILALYFWVLGGTVPLYSALPRRFRSYQYLRPRSSNKLPIRYVTSTECSVITCIMNKEGHAVLERPPATTPMP